MAVAAPLHPDSRIVAFPEPRLRGRVLIVDDTFFMRVLLRSILDGAGHTVVGEATTGREAVSMFRLFRPDVVIMDITMPQQDGLAAMEEILRGASGAQVIVCTSMQFRRTATEAIARGARDFITKPFRPETILRAVDGVLRRHRAQDSGILRRGHQGCEETEDHDGGHAQFSGRLAPPGKELPPPGWQ